MPEEWLSVAQAAAALKVHPRTIERRMVANKIESRKNDDGQVQVLITLPDLPEPAPSTEAVSSEAFETVKELANQQVDIAAGSASALVRVAQEQAHRAENQLLVARQDAGRYRRESRFAVGLVAVILVMVIGAVFWCTREITQSQADVRRASESAAAAAMDAKAAQDQLATKNNKLDAALADRDSALLGKAKAEGELAAYKTELSGVVKMTQIPATKPSPLERMTQALLGN
jgi:hypothetical protein